MCNGGVTGERVNYGMKGCSKYVTGVTGVKGVTWLMGEEEKEKKKEENFLQTN